MESLVELCDLIAQNPTHFADKLAWICSRCPSTDFLLVGSPRVSRSHLNAILALARFLSKCPNHDHETPKSLLLAFYRSIPSSFHPNFWPQSFSSDSISTFFKDLLNYISKASESSPDFATDVAGFTGEIVTQTISNTDSSISSAFLKALCLHFPPILPSDGNKLISTLLERFEIAVPSSPRETISTHDVASVQSSPMSLNHYQYQSPGNEASIVSAGSSGSRVSRDDPTASQGILINGASNGDFFSGSVGLSDGGRGGGAVAFRKVVASFEEEPVESLEKQQIVFELVGHVLDKVVIDSNLLEQVRGIAKQQLQSMMAFLKIRKRDWSEQGQLLKVRINTKLSVYHAAARLQVKTLSSLDSEGKTSKRLLHGALALLIEAAEACLFSVWRKLSVCEELFCSFLAGISQAAVTRGGQLLRVLLIRFKPLVLATCAQADTWASSQGAMFVSILKTSCEIIEFGWVKDRSPVDTFIMGLAASIRERNDYEEEDGKEKQAAPPVQLNVIRLLADLNVSVHKPEIVDMILPLFIESLEEGDASTAGLLRLRVVSSVKWLEDELELNALHDPGSRRGNGIEKTVVNQRTALSAALGGRMEVSAMSTISGVKATYLLAVAFLEIIRFSSNGGILNGDHNATTSQSAFSCVFEYLKSPNLMPAVSQCLTSIVHRSFETAMSWLDDRASETGIEAEVRESTLSIHACFLIRNLSQRDEHIRDISVSLLTQLRDRFPQILWSSSCLDSLLLSMHNDPPSNVVSDPAYVASVRSLYQRMVREWITVSLSYAPCTSQGLLQENLCKANTWQRTQPTADVVSLLSEIRIGTGKNDCWVGTKTANIPAVMAAAAAASGGNLKLSDAFNLEVLGTGIVSATVKCNHAGEIAGMKRLYESLGGDLENPPSLGYGLNVDLPVLESSVQPTLPKNGSFNEILFSRFVRLLQKFVSTAEKGGEVDKLAFRETCSHSTALLLSSMHSDSKSNVESFSQLLRLLCWCPAYITTPDAVETGVYVWTWLVSAAPLLGSVVLAELVDAWLWTVDTKRGLFASDIRYSGPSAKLRPHLAPGEPEPQPEKDPVEQILAHRLWLGFFIDRFEVVRHASVEQLLLLGRMLQGSAKLPWNFSRHPAATGTFFTLMLFGLKFCSCQSQRNLHNFRSGLQLLEDRIYRASLGWFAHTPEWFDLNNNNFTQSEAQSISIFVHHLLNDRSDTQLDLRAQGLETGSSLNDVKDQHHPVWGPMENYAVGREKRRQLLLMMCQHEADRLEVWAQPVGPKENTSRVKVSSEKWTEFGRTAFSVDPRIALSLAARFPSVAALKTETTQLVQNHILEIRSIPEALPYFVTSKAVDENSTLLQHMPHWAACSITQALDFLSPAYKGHPRVMAYVLRVLESYPPERVTFFMPQLVQSLRYDEGRLVEGYLLRAAQRSDIFAHILIWHLQGETCVPESGKDPASVKNSSFQALLPVVRQRIIDGFHPKALDLFRREFDFFDKVTSISGVLFPLPKEERRAGIRRELEKIQVEGNDLYLPTAPNKLVSSIQVDSGIPLQSAAKVPIMITFNVVDRDGNCKGVKPQACIFKVGDDCRQDVLALQVISLLKDIFEAVGLDLYLFPYGVLPTDPERGIIEVVPNTRSRSQMGETTDGGLFEIFQQDFGPVGSPSFEAARENFLISSAGYAVASLLLQPKDRHNGNLLFDNLGRLVHIDFGFILETSPGGNMRFESAHFKLSHEMTQLLDPSGVMKSETWHQFVSLCVKGYLAARRYMDGIINTVSLMIDSGLPCFSRGDPIGNLRKRFHPEMTEREAANFMIRTCTDAYNKWTTAGYDLIQYLQQGIEK
ncbi:phosphatidylinositol 4-kinase alpha 1-like isoform X3 [Primulina huaijiensis]|uniref:phosphatidylinositol 4-kinase alpha 1-like isoform X3 n=1 Tax=Primulina huaijiensis TaxID=1492673 RepID=UPI003CC73B15